MLCYVLEGIEFVYWVRLYVALDTKQVISETFFLANLLARHWKKNYSQQN